MSAKLRAILKKKEQKRSQLSEKAKTSNDREELRSINSEMDELGEEIDELRGALDDDSIEGSQSQTDLGTGETESLEQRNNQSQPAGSAMILGTYGMQQANGNESRSVVTDPYATLEYRNAFMNLLVNDEDSEVLRAVTGATDVSKVIPTTIMNKVVEKMTDYGRIFKRITKTNIKGGVSVPVSTIKPIASWVTGNNMSAEQKKGISGNVQFSYYKLQCRVAVDLIAGTVSLDVFEKLLIDNIYEAMIVAIEAAVISGDGNNMPKGIINHTIPDERVIEITEEEFGKYGTWPAIFAKMPRKYRAKMSVIMNDADWNKHIVGMTDKNGQPVGRVTYGLNGTIEESIIGREAIPLEDYIPSITDASVGDVIGVLVNLKDYALNSNMQMTFKKYFDEDTDQHKYKNTMIADGKLVDTNGVVLIKKKASA
jgi:HK97 family phage major capsid protein